MEKNYGPLACLIGSWEGESGLDVSPESDGVEQNSYREKMQFSPIGEVVNAEAESLMVLKYQQEVFRIRDAKRIHDQMGYWMWNSVSNQIIHSFVIPRGVTVIAGGKYNQVSSSKLECEVAASCDNEQWPVSQTQFMQNNAKTLSFSMQVSVDAGRLSYQQKTNLAIYGDDFEHTEESVLVKVSS